MLWVIRIIIGLLALLFLLLGLGFLLDPIPAAGRMGLEAMDLTGMSSLRGDLAGLFFASTVMMVLGLWRGHPTWFLAVAVLMGAIAFGRVIGFALDGATSTSLTAFATEIGTILFMVFAAWRLPQLKPA